MSDTHKLPPNQRVPDPGHALAGYEPWRSFHCASSGVQLGAARSYSRRLRPYCSSPSGRTCHIYLPRAPSCQQVEQTCGR